MLTRRSVRFVHVLAVGGVAACTSSMPAPSDAGLDACVCPSQCEPDAARFGCLADSGWPAAPGRRCESAEVLSQCGVSGPLSPPDLAT